jgi:uncharacterized protein
VASAAALDGDDCTQCGACCAAFRVDFAVEESADQGGQVPHGLTVPVTAFTQRMRGTDHAQPRCAALSGQIGQRIACGIYEWRPSPCRELEPGSDACLKSRLRHKLNKNII